MNKIRTEEELYDYIDLEWSWRRKELTALKANIYGARNSAKSTALRSGIALLYAHWEGLVKNVATAYLNYVSNKRLRYNQLKDNFFALSVKDGLKEFDETLKASRYNKIIIDIRSKKNDKSCIPYENVIKTKSNLNSDIFVEIMETIGLDYSSYESQFKLLDGVLLKMRNEIAHGERVESLSLDEERFNEIYDKVIRMMDQFRTQIQNAVALKEYMIKETDMG